MKFLAFLSFLLLFTSCSAEPANNQPVVAEKNFIAYHQPYTKTTLDPDLNLNWTVGDKVSVFGKEVMDRHQKFKVVEADGNRAQLKGRIIANEQFYALYPYRESNQYSQRGLTFQIPADQIPVAGSLSDAFNPSYAISEGENLPFHNLGSLIRFTLPGNIPSDFVKATLTGAAEESLAGTYTVSLSDGSLVPQDRNQLSTEVVLEGQMKAGETYHFVVAPTTFEQGLRFQFESDGGLKFSAELEDKIEADAGQVVDCGQLTVNSEGNVYPGTTEIGRKLAQAEGIMQKLISDQSWTITEGLVASEVAFYKADGLETRTFFLEIDLNCPNITLYQTTPNNKEIGDALQAVTRQALLAEEGKPGLKIWAGTNSDFFDMKKGTNLPHGIFHHDGKVYKDFFNPNIKRKMSFFYLTKDKKVGIALQKDYNAVASKEDILEAFGGGELLVDKGKVLDNPQPLEPRTCIGMTADGKKVMIMVADGRRNGYSNGLTLNELAKCMQAIGAYTSINLDGGGSSTFFVRNPDKAADDPARFEVRNRPSDNRERGVATGLVIIDTGK